MGFDNECILNIQSLAGEYFCPVCRTLVYPNEALQSQCTHLYCKPCLAYVVSSTQACPYDGYLVTEAGSKPLTESNKALAETIGKIAVHCLYHRSGCTWQGSLSECTSHCSGCAFGNSPVVCNRCGVQIVHRQVQEHAQTCNVNGANAQTQPGTESVQDSASSGAVVASEQSKSGTQTGVQASQSQAPQTAAPPPGQNPNQQGITNPQSQAVAPSAAPTPEQWYQYQQYYQQYPGYDPYQQAFQQYYPYQLQAAQQFQQQPPLLQGQPQPQVQAPTPGQAQPQVQPQPQAQPPSHSQAQPLNVPHGPPQPHLYAQAPMASQNQTQAQPNQPQHLHPAVQPHSQIQSQTHLPPPPPPHGLIPQPYSQAPPHSVQTHPQQHMQGPQHQYQQAPAQLHHPQAPPVHPHPYAQGHPQAQYQSHAQSQPQSHPPQSNQPPTLNAPPQNHHSSIQSVTGHHSYPQPHGHQQMQQAPPQQHMMHIQPSGGSLPPTQVQSQFPQPPAHVRPPPPHGFPPNQQPAALLTSQGQTSSIPPAQQQIHPNNQQSGPSVHQRPIMQPNQQQMPQQYVQQLQPFAGQVSSQVQNQVHPSHFTPQQSQLRPQGPPQTMQQHPLAYGQPQQTVALPHGMQPNQSQNHAARPIMPNHGVQLQQFPQSTGAIGVPPQVRPPQHNASQQLVNPNYVNTVNNQLQASSEQPFVQSGFLANSKVAERKGDQTSEKSVEQKEAGSPSQKPIEKDVISVGADLAEGKSDLGMKSVGNEHNPSSEGDDSYKHEETLIKDAISEGYQGKDASGDPLIRQGFNEGKESTLEHSLGGNSLQSGSVAGKDGTGAPLKQAEKNVINTSLQASTEGDKGPLAAPLASIQNVIPHGNSQPFNGKDHLQHGPGGDESGGFQGSKGFDQSSHPAQFADHGRRQIPPMPYGPSGHQQRPTVPSMSQAVPPTGPPSNGQVPGHLPLRPLGPRHMPQPGQVLNPPEHLQPPALRQPGSFHPDNALGGVPEAGSTASYGRGPSQFGNTQRSVELQYGAPLGQYNQGPIPSSHSGISRMSQGEPAGPPMSAVPPGSFELQDRMIGRAPMLRGPEGQIGPPRPITPMEGDFHNHRPPHFDGRRSDSHVPGSLEKGPFGQPFGSESNPMGMNGAAGGMRDERFKAVEDRSNPFPMGPNRRLDQAEFHDSLKQLPRPSHMGNEASPKFGNNFLSSRPMDGGPQGLGVDGPSRSHDKGTPGFNYDAGRNTEPSATGATGGFLPLYRPGALHPSDSGERARAVGNYDDNRGRLDSGRTNLDFLGTAPGFNRHHMDGLPPRSPGREYLGNQSRPFGGFSGGIDDIDGRETHPFGEGSRPFNLPSGSVGPVHESRFPVRPPGHVRRGEFDGPGNIRMGEHLRSGDLIGQDVLPNHLRRGEPFNPRNMSGHPPSGEPGFGSFHGYGRIGEVAGPGGFHHRPFGEPFGKSSHPRLGEPGFRSSYSLQGFPNDASFYPGDPDSFDKLRKWKSVSTGWCRICKVDCETVEGLDMHSQTREHQKMTMDMVISIKQKNSKKQKTSNDHSAREEGSKSRNASFQGRGKKP